MSPRAAVTVFFALDGFAVASFFARLPATKDRLDLSSGRIGLALLGLTVALVISQPLTGGLAARHGSAPLVIAGGLTVSVAIAAPAFAGSFDALLLSTAAIGFTTGVLDVSMNVQGVAVERRLDGGLMTGPPLVGFLAEATSLRFSLAAVLGLLCLAAAALASAVR